MLVKAGRRDEEGSALVSVLVMMLVLTLFALTLAAVVANTTKTLVGGRDTWQARAAADAGIAAGLAGFRAAEACPVSVESTTSPVYQVDCAVAANTVTFTSTGVGQDGAQVRVEAVYGFTHPEVYDAGGLAFFSSVEFNEPNEIRSNTADPAHLSINDGNLYCHNSMAVNAVVENNFYAYSGCSVTGSVEVKGDARVYQGSTISGSLLTQGFAYVDGVVKGNVTAGGYVYVASSGSISGNVTAASADVMYIYGQVGGDLAGNGAAYIYYNARVSGKVTSARDDLNYVYGTIGKSLTAAGEVTIYTNGSVVGEVVAGGSGRSYVYGKAGASFKAAGAVTLDYSGSVEKDLVAAGADRTYIYSTVRGDVEAGGAVTIDYSGTVVGDVVAAGGSQSSVYGLVKGSFVAAGLILIDYSGVVESDVYTTAGGTDRIYGRIGEDLRAGGAVNLYTTGKIGKNLTLPSSSKLSPSDASSRIGGTITWASAPSAPKAPTVTVDSAALRVGAPASPEILQWQDYEYSAADWAGYTVSVVDRNSVWCNSRDWGTHLGALTTPTVIDATACKSGISNHPRSMTQVMVRTDVVVVSTEIDLQYLTLRSATGSNPHLWFIVPSSRHQVKDYSGVSEGDGTITLDSTNISMPTLLYTPDDVDFYSSTFKGSIYADDLNTDWGSMWSISANSMKFPVQLFPGSGTGSGGAGFSVTRISQREIQ